MDAVEGTLLNFVNADKSQTAAAIYMHENKLDIIEGTVPAQSIYHNGYQKPEATHRPVAEQ